MLRHSRRCREAMAELSLCALIGSRNAAPGCHRLAMNPVKLIAIVLIVAGLLGLVYGGFSYTKDTTFVKLGPLEVSAKERQTVNVPMWAGVGAIVVGGLLLVFAGKR
jgi:hypothetical protein